MQLEEGVETKGKRFSEHNFQCPTEKVAEKKCCLVISSTLKNLAEKIKPCGFLRPAISFNILYL